jgi:hypothetical protein
MWSIAVSLAPILVVALVAGIGCFMVARAFYSVERVTAEECARQRAELCRVEKELSARIDALWQHHQDPEIPDPWVAYRRVPHESQSQPIKRRCELVPSAFVEQSEPDKPCKRCKDPARGGLYGFCYSCMVQVLSEWQPK